MKKRIGAALCACLVAFLLLPLDCRGEEPPVLADVSCWTAAGVCSRKIQTLRDKAAPNLLCHGHKNSAFYWKASLFSCG